SRPRTTSLAPVPRPAPSPPISSSPLVSSVSRFSERWRVSTSSTCALSMPRAPAPWRTPSASAPLVTSSTLAAPALPPTPTSSSG
ncbi:hypothetical protein BN1708_016491, partial [Verticillium longisporum]